MRPVPDPVVQLNGSLGGEFDFAEFRAAVGLLPVLDDVPFDAKCDVDGFEMIYIQTRHDPVSVENDGERFSTQTLSVTARAIPGDTYLFVNLRVICPGDMASRGINSLAFSIR